MTIAAGILCEDGMVLCADTEESISAERKGRQGKLRVTQKFALGNGKQFEWTIGVAGAGHSDWVLAFIEGMPEKVMEQFDLSGTESSTVRELLARYAQEFFRKYIRSYAADPEQRPQVQMVVLMQHPEPLEKDLLRVSDNLVLGPDTNSYVTVGTGGPVFSHLADSLLKRSYNMRQTASIVAYIMDRVKSEVPGCGGNSHIVMIGEDHCYTPIPTRRVRELEIHHADAELRINDALAAELLKELP